MVFFFVRKRREFMFFFFFSSRRRHTRFDCDWSSDVCSSDLQSDPKNLSAAAGRGDNLAEAVWQDIGLKIGVGLTNVIWLVNPDRIVIGGGVANAGERLFGYIRRTIRTRCEKTFWEKLEVVPATLGNDAVIIGAATLALESEFRP